MSFRDRRTLAAIRLRRRLGFELLERRDLLAVMRIVTWNSLNNPDDAAEDAAFATVLQAIGNETVQGNTQRIDILALQETDAPGVGDSSIARIQSVLNGLYPSANYEFVVSTTFAETDSTGFVFDTTAVSLLESVPVGAGSLTHTSMRAKFRPADTFGESDFYVYSVHLKSGTAAAEATTRASEAALLRADADSLNEGANVLFVGDFNMKGSEEGAFVNFVASGPGQLQDVAGAPLGHWNDNAAFKLLHSQDPRFDGVNHFGMDDRFDIHFATGEVFDGLNFEYVAGSYHVFGNNGMHMLNGAITSGSGASMTVLNALVAASDHLPVVADYQVVASTPKVRISETLGGTKVVEGGLYDTYQVVLDTVPAANVDVTVTPNSQVDVGNGAGISKVFTFTPANALTPQTVVVTAVNDLVGEGNHTGSITHSSASSDAAYNALTIAGVNVAIVDNDAPTIVINELDSDQANTDTAEFIELYDGGVGNVSLNGLILVFFNGNQANNGAYRIIALNGKSTDANGYFLVGNTGVMPLPGVTFPNDTLQNGADAVALYAAPASDFTTSGGGTPPVNDSRLRDAIVYDTDDADDADLIMVLTPGQPQLNENENGGNSFETESLSRRPDGGTPYNSSAYVAQSPTPGTFNQAPPYGVQFVQSSSRVDVAEGGATDSYQIALQTIPTSNVTITVDPDNQTNLGFGAGVAIVLTFTPANALIPQTVNVTAVDDGAIEGVHTSVITHTAASADSHYNGLAISNVVANVVDNDVAPPTSIVISEIMFNPATDESGPSSPEWIEVVNTGTAATELGGWRFDDEDSLNWGAIPAGTILNPNQIAVFFDATFTTAPAFRSDWAVPAGALVVGIGWGNLANSPSPTNEILKMFNNINEEKDVVNFDDASPWPSAANGPSIYLKNLAADNNVGSNWGRSMTIVGAVSPTGGNFSALDVGSPGRVFTAGDYNLNGVVDAGDYALWRKNPADNGGAGGYDVWRANFGAIGVPNGGLGSGSELAGGGESGGMAAASLLSAASSTSSVPESSLATPSIESRTAAGVAADGGTDPPATSVGRSRHPSRWRAAAIAADRADSLLSLRRSTALPPHTDEAFATHDMAADDHCAVVDRLFATLEDVRVLTHRRRFSSI